MAMITGGMDSTFIIETIPLATADNPKTTVITSFILSVRYFPQAVPMSPPTNTAPQLLSNPIGILILPLSFKSITVSYDFLTFLACRPGP